MIEYYLFILLGVVAGLISGLLGISGGVVTVPALFLIFKFMNNMPASLIMHLAIGTSLASMVFSSLSSLCFHQKRGAVLWPLVLVLLPALIVGSLTGGVLANYLSGRVLKVIFGAFAFCVAIHFFMPPRPIKESQPLPSKKGLTAVGFGTAALANILGIGGGIFIAPFLMHHHISHRHAIASSAATGFFITLLGACSYLYFGWSNTSSTTLGYLYLPAFFTLSVVTLLVAPFGVALAHKLPISIVRRIFALVLLIIGIFMVWGA